MAISSANASAAPKVRKVETLTSGTSWTVPAGVEYVNATRIGGGGSGGLPASADALNQAQPGCGGQIITTSVTTTPGASIAYAIGAGGASQTSNANYGNAGGNTTFTGATTALGGNGGSYGRAVTGAVATSGLVALNGGATGFQNAQSSTGGAGQIILEYWK